MSPILGTSGGVLCSSPPAKSSSVSIKSGRPLSKSVPCQDVAAEGRHSFARRVSETGSKLSFGGGRTISISSTPSASCSKPPVAPSAPRAVHVGFAAPESSGVCVSPGRRETKSSLLSRALLDTPTLGNNELFGCAAPMQSFQGLVVVSEKVTDVDMQPLVQLQALHPVFRDSTVAAAYAVAARAHAGQVRKSGDTVLSHCTATALILAELGLPPDVVAAGLLHDVLCDTSMQPWQLSQVLPDSVVSLVTKVHQLNQLSQTYRDNTHTLEAEAMLDMLTGMEDVTALLIKLADRLHNMRTIGSLARCKQVRMASETLDVFAVLANRLGTWSIKAELEDLCFKILNPEEYQLVADAIAARAAAHHSSSALAAGVNEIITSLQAAGLQVVDVSGRVKNVYGVWKKVQKNLHAIARGFGLTISSCSSSDDDQEPSSPVSPATAVAAPSGISSSDGTRALAAALAQVYDIQALRVVVPHKHDCYVAQRVVEQLWSPMPGRTKDYIRHRKANGYQSLHLTVHDASGQPLEVQIRTPKMHYIAEYGFAAHWKYKEKLGRQDLWLDRLVQWKRWIASVKLGLHDHKVRPSGSPGSGGDAAVAGLAAKLGLEAALAGGTSSQGLAAGGVAAPFRSISAGDAVAAELQAMEHQQLAAAAAVVAPAGRTEMSSSPADAKFAARFRMQPISEAEIDAHGASIMISGPRGVSIAQLPARCTVAQLLSSQDFAGQLSRANSGGLMSALSQLQIGLGLPSVSSSGCRVAVNGVVVLPSMADHVVLRSGDQVQLLDDPLLALGLPGTGSDVGGMQMADQRAAGARLPGVMADAGKTLGLYVSGQLESMEVALQQKLRVASRVPVRSPALVS